MAPPRFEVSIEDASGNFRPLSLALTQSGGPAYQAKLVRAMQPPVVIGEASYGQMIADRGGVYAQQDVSLGVGSKTQKQTDHADSKRVYFCEWMDTSVAGQIQKGPGVTTLTAPANSGPMSGYFELAGSPYLVLGRRIASWASDSLTAQNDFSAGTDGTGAATFFQLGTESNIESSTGTGSGSSTIDDANDVVAQSIRIDDTGLRILTRVDIEVTKTGSPTGNLRCRVMTDVDGRPNTDNVLGTANIPCATTSGNQTLTFRFDNDLIPIVYQQIFWVAVDVVGASAGNSYALTLSTANTYTPGLSSVSADAGNTWTNNASGFDLRVNIYAKSVTTTAFVGSVSSNHTFVTTTSGSSYTSDSWLTASQFTVINDVLVRDAGAGDGNPGAAVCFSIDGTNWSEPIPVGNSSVQITSLVPLGSSTLIVCKQDGIWAVDFSDLADVAVTNVYTTGKVSTNGKGAAAWRDAAYVPMDGRLMAVQGDFNSDFTLSTSIGPECLPEYDFPHGTGRVTAVRGDRFHLYATLSATGGHRLYKASQPLRKVDDRPAPDWNGSIATIGDGTQDLSFLAIFDPGGTGSPQLFATTTSNNVARIQLPRTANPAGDTSYPYDITTTGDVYYPRAHGNLGVHPKSWVSESTTFQRATPGDYIEVLYDTLDGESWRRMPRNGRLYDTGALPYPKRAASRLLARRLRMTNSLTTTCPLILTSGLGYVVRQIASQAAWEITFTVVLDESLSGIDLGDLLGITGASMADLLEAASIGDGSRMMKNPWGKVYDRVMFVDYQPSLDDAGGLGHAQIVALAVG